MKSVIPMWCRKQAAAALCVLLLFTCASGHADEESVTQASAFEHIVSKTYQPRHEQFVQATGELMILSQRLCEMPSEALLLAVQDQFAVVVTNFSGIELYRLGPLLQENRQNRLFYWPDKRRVGERQLRSLLLDPEAHNLRGSDLVKKSVAVQGLPALERLLFGSETATRIAPDSPAADCPLVMAIVDNLHTMAGSLQQGWASDAEIVQAIRQPAADSAYFRSEEEVLRSMATQISVGLDVVINRKLVPLVDADRLTLRKAPFWKSGLTLSNLTANLDSIRALLIDSGLAELTELDNELTFEFRTAAGMLVKLEALPSMMDDTGELTPVARSLIKSLSAALGGLQLTVNDRFMSSLGISAGFNSEDGD